MPRPEFPEFLERALDVLCRETPAAHAAVATALEVTPLRIAVDGHERVLRFDRGRHELAPDGHALGELSTDGATILALVDDELRLLDAILEERLFLRGSVPVVSRFESALRAFLAGAVRAPGLPPLLHAYRACVAAPRCCD